MHQISGCLISSSSIETILMALPLQGLRAITKVYMNLPDKKQV